MAAERPETVQIVAVADLDAAAAAARLVEIDARLVELTTQVEATTGDPPTAGHN